MLVLSATPSEAYFAPFLLRGVDPADAFALAGELGYDGVEMHLRQASDIDRAAVRQLASDHGLTVPTLGTGLAAGMDGLTFASPDPVIRRRAVERVKQHIDLAAWLNASVIIGSLSGRVGNDPEQRQALRATALDCLAECCRAAADAGVTMLLEALNRYECDYLNTIQDVLDVIAEIRAPNLKVLADTFHMNIEEIDIAASLRRAGDKLGHVHLADTNRQAPGHGHLNVGSVLQALQDISYRGYISFEVFPKPDARQAAADAIQTVKGILAQAR